MIGYGWRDVLATVARDAARQVWAWLMRVARTMKALSRDESIPRWLRVALVACCLPIIGPADEIALVILAGVVWLVYRDRVRTAWVQSGAPRCSHCGTVLVVEDCPNYGYGEVHA